MVYDEAIEFGMGKKNTNLYSNFLVFMNYSPNDGKTLPEVKTKFYSHCYQTIIGWFRTDGNKWGCVWGHKKVPNWKNPTNGEAPAKQRVLEKSIEKETFMEKDSHISEDKKGNEMKFLQVTSNLKTKANANMKTKTQEKTKLKLNASFKDHAEIARRINSLNLGWTAKVYDDIKDKTIGEMNKMYGEYNPRKEENDFRFKSVSRLSKFSSELEENFYNNFYIANEGKRNFWLFCF